MTLSRTRSFARSYARLPARIRQKVDKQLRMLAKDSRHPSLHTKRVKGHPDIWEARVDYQHRFTFMMRKSRVILRSVGSHDILKKP